jgi:hypothetical protein
MDPQEFLQLASELVRGSRAAELRTAISRAYYAVYNVSVEILAGMGFRIDRGPGGHGDVQKYLGNSRDPEVEKIGSQLVDLHGRRIRADYRLDNKDIENQKTARALVEQAGRMIRTLDECRSEPRRAQIINAIRDWERKVSRPRQ